MNVETTDLPGVVTLTPRRFGDDRGFFAEVYNARALAGHGIDAEFVQDNQSLSREVGVVRGLHYQTPPHAQAKLVRAGRGRVFDVAVDIRRGSPTFGRWTGVELSAEAGNQLFIPEGFAHGFSVLEPDSELLYKCTDYYAPQTEGAVRFDDPDLAIDWGIPAQTAILSEKDAAAPYLAQIDSPFTFEAQS